jgi:hypothetical protein
MDLDYSPDSWAAGEIDDIRDEVVDLQMQLDIAQTDVGHANDKTVVLLRQMADNKVQAKIAAQETNNKLAMKCVTYSNIIDTLKHIVKYGRKPGADDTIKLNLLLKQGGYPPI